MGRAPIIDQFSELRVSPQRKSQLRMRAKGICPTCKRPLKKKSK